MAELSLQDFIKWLSGKTTTKINGRVISSGTQGEQWGLTADQANKYIKSGQIDKITGHKAYLAWQQSTGMKNWYPSRAPLATDFPIDPKTGLPSTTPTAPVPPAAPATPTRPYETQWRSWFEATYPGDKVENASKEVRAWWEQNILPTIIAGETGRDPAAEARATAAESAAARSADLAERRFQWEVGQVDAERERQQAEARNKAWSLQNESQRMQSESAIEKQRNEIELIKGRSFPFPYEQGNRAAYQDMQRTAFENARQSILGSLTSPADWVKKWEVEHAPNPYTPQPQSPLEQSQGEVDNTNTRVNMFNQMANEAEKLVATLSADPAYAVGANSPNEASILTRARNDAVNYRNAANAEMGKLPAFQADVTYLQGQPQPAPSQPVRPSNAPAPGWLPMFAPGQRAGQPITRENVATPSAQQWAATPWSVQQGLSGYLDWAGYRPMADVLGNMAQMLPNAPGGGARWSPLLGR